MQLPSGTVYPHEELDEVLVLGVHHVFDEYDLESRTGRIRTRVVRHTDAWDDYGPMPSSVRTTPADAFRRRVGEPRRTVDFIGPTGEDERSDDHRTQ